MSSYSSSGTALYLSYIAPHMAIIWLMQPLPIIQGIYAKYYGLSLTAIATAILIARVFDAVTDPVIGLCVDRYFDRHQTRKPFMVIGSLLFSVSAYFLYVPPDNVSALYFAICFMAMTLAWTLFEIPHIAWANDIAVDSHEKTTIYGF